MADDAKEGCYYPETAGPREAAGKLRALFIKIPRLLVNRMHMVKGFFDDEGADSDEADPSRQR